MPSSHPNHAAAYAVVALLLTLPLAGTRALAQASPGAPASPGPGAKPAPPVVTDWQLAGSLGMLQFIVVPEARSRDRAWYGAVVAQACPEQTTCFLRFFTNSTNAPLQVPLPDAILHEQTAMFQRSMKAGRELFQFSCRLGVAEPECF
jgi:hypothetical protein